MRSSPNYWTRTPAGWRTSRRRLLAGMGAAGAGAAGFALVGCGDDSSSTADSPTPAGAGSPAASASASVTAETPKPGGTLSVAFGGAASEQPHQDPHMTPTLLLHNLGSGLAYSRLVRLKVGRDVALGARVPYGDLAGSWEQPDKTTYVFKIRPEAKWQSAAPVNGRSVTAADVVYSFGRQRDLKVNASSLDVVDTLTALDDKTLKITTKAPNVDALLAIADFPNKIVAREVVEKYGDLKTAPVIGSGAWIQEEWQQGSVVRFKKNPDYFLKDAQGRALPYADKLEILRIPDMATTLAAFRTKKYLVYGQYFGNKKDMDQLVKENPQLVQVDQSVIGSVGTQVGVRTDSGPGADVRVRQAVSRLIDRKGIIDGLLFGAGWFTSNVVTPAPDWTLSQKELESLLPYDPKAAKALLDQAGVSGWNPEMKFLFLAAQQATAEAIQPSLQEVKVNAKLASCDTACNADAVGQGKFDLLVTSGLRASNPTADLNIWFKGGGSRNGVKLNDPEINRLIDAQSAEFDAKARKDLLMQLQRKVLDAAAWIPVNGGGLPSQLVWPDLKNWLFAVYGENMQYEVAWLNA